MKCCRYSDNRLPFSGPFLVKITGLRRWTITFSRKGAKQSPQRSKQFFFACFFAPLRLCAGLVLRLPVVVLFELSVQRLAPNAEGASSVRFVSLGVVEGGLNCLAFDLFH